MESYCLNTEITKATCHSTRLKFLRHTYRAYYYLYLVSSIRLCSGRSALCCCSDGLIFIKVNRLVEVLDLIYSSRLDLSTIYLSDSRGRLGHIYKIWCHQICPVLMLLIVGRRFVVFDVFPVDIFAFSSLLGL